MGKKEEMEKKERAKERNILGEKAGCLIKYLSCLESKLTKEELDKIKQRAEEIEKETKSFALKWGSYTKEELEKLEEYTKKSKFDKSKKKKLEEYLNKEVEVEWHSLVGDKPVTKGLLLRVEDALLCLDHRSKTTSYIGNNVYECIKEPGKKLVYIKNGVEVEEEEFLKECNCTPLMEAELEVFLIKKIRNKDKRIIYDWLT